MRARYSERVLRLFIVLASLVLGALVLGPPILGPQIVAAQACVAQHGSELPRNFDALLALPGIGRSTAGAILAQAWDERFPILDGNVKRVLARYHGIDGWPGTPAVEKQLWARATRHLPTTRMADYTQAQMDFGATLCTRFAPACATCPLQSDCVALHEDRVSQLPAPKPTRTLPERSALVLLLQDHTGRVILQRRPATGVWAGLWSLPEATDPGQARGWFDQYVDATYADGESLQAITHVFSHYRLQLQPVHWREVALHNRVADNEDLRWVGHGALASLGIPAPIRKLVESVLAQALPPGATT